MPIPNRGSRRARVASNARVSLTTSPAVSSNPVLMGRLALGKPNARGSAAPAASPLAPLSGDAASGGTVAEARRADRCSRRHGPLRPVMVRGCRGLIPTFTDRRRTAVDKSKGTLLQPQTQQQRLRGKKALADTTYGFAIFNEHGRIGHNGAVPGYPTVVVALPDQGATLVVNATNDIFGTDGGQRRGPHRQGGHFPRHPGSSVHRRGHMIRTSRTPHAHEGERTRRRTHAARCSVAEGVGRKVHRGSAAAPQRPRHSAGQARPEIDAGDGGALGRKSERVGDQPLSVSTTTGYLTPLGASTNVKVTSQSSSVSVIVTTTFGTSGGGTKTTVPPLTACRIQAVWLVDVSSGVSAGAS